MACRRVEDFELHKQLYKGKASLLYSATCKRTGIPIALKLYRKGRLSELNWHQASSTSLAPLLLIGGAQQHALVIYTCSCCSNLGF